MPRAPLLSGHYPKSSSRVDCGRDTAPGLPGRAELAELVATRPDVKMAIDDRAEIYAVRKAVWTAAGMKTYGGCLCIGCLERRLGRRLGPKDFPRGHPFNQTWFPASPRLKRRRARSAWSRLGRWMAVGKHR